MTAKPRIGFVGLGNMGAPMAENLLKAGFELAVADADPGRLAGFATRAALPASLAELGRTSDLVVTMLPDGKIVRTVLCGSPDNKVKRFILPRRYGAGLSPGLMAKDLRPALETAEARATPAPLAAACIALWNAAEARLGGAADHTEIARYLETLIEEGR